MLSFLRASSSALFVVDKSTSVFGTELGPSVVFRGAPGPESPKFVLGGGGGAFESFVANVFPARYHTPAFASLGTYLSSSTNTKYPTIPRKIWQTAKRWNPNTFSEWQYQDGYEYTFMNNDDADRWVSANFAGTPIHWTWEHLNSGIMKSDLLRYLLLLFEGGTYSDTDVHLLQPIDTWGQYPDLLDTKGGTGGPSLIIGVEADVGDRIDWHTWWPRPLQMCQWTLSSAPFHPVFIDVVRRIHEYTVKIEQWKDEQGLTGDAGVEAIKKLMDGNVNDSKLSVMDWTGPGTFTDAVMTYLAAQHALQWPALKDLKRPLRVHDMVILSVTGFSPGVGLFNAGEVDDPQAMVHHMFAGSWKHDH